MLRFVHLIVALLLSGCSSSEDAGDAGDQEGGGGSGDPSSGGHAAEGGASPGCAAPAGVGEFALGTGETCFEPLSDGQTVPLIAGPQGGYHVWLAVGCEDCGSQPTLQWAARDPATGEIFPGTYPSEAIIDLGDESWPQAAGFFVNMPGIEWDPEGDPPPAPGTHVLLWARVSGETIHEATIEVIVGDTIYWDPCVENPEDEMCEEFG